MLPIVSAVRLLPIAICISSWLPIVSVVEGVLLTCDSVAMFVSSSSAFEYYYEDTTSYRSLKFAHLDLHFEQIQGDQSSLGICQCFEIWMVIKGAPPIAADPGGFPDFLIFRFVGKCGFWDFSGGIWGLGGFAIDGKWLWASNERILSSYRAMWVHF